LFSQVFVLKDWWSRKITKTHSSRKKRKEKRCSWST